MESIGYSSADITPLTMPDVLAVTGGWTSAWWIDVRRTVASDALAVLSSAILNRCQARVEFSAVEGEPVRMVLHSPDHPFDVESYLLIDCVLRAIHEALGIDQINGWPRDKWRTFRSQEQNERPCSSCGRTLKHRGYHLHRVIEGQHFAISLWECPACGGRYSASRNLSDMAALEHELVPEPWPTGTVWPG